MELKAIKNTKRSHKQPKAKRKSKSNINTYQLKKSKYKINHYQNQ